MNRYFPEVIPHVLALPGKKLVLDGELVIEVDGVQEFDLLSQRIHPAKSRVDMLAEKTPASFVAFDLLAEGKKKLLEAALRRAARAARGGRSRTRSQLTPMTDDREGAGAWLTGQSEGVVAKEADAPYLPGRAQGDGEDQARPHARRRGRGVPLRQGGGHGRLADPRALRQEGRAARRRPHVGLHARSRRGAAAAARAVPDGRARVRRAEPLEVGRGAQVGGPAARARVRDRLRPHHGQPHPPRGEVHALARGQGPARVHDRPAARA